MALSNRDLDQLETILFSDSVADESLDYFGLHGALCASVVGPVNMPDEQLVQLTFSGEESTLSDDQIEHVKRCMDQIKQEVLEHLQDGTPILLPFEDEEDYENALESWCAGFMEGFFQHEKSWFTKGEEIPAELLLPIMALSGLFDSEEFSQIRDNERLMSQFESILGDQLTDIFLFYHSD